MTLSPHDRDTLRPLLASARDVTTGYLNRTFLGDYRDIAPLLPRGFADLLFLDPPYNMDKQFGDTKFSRLSVAEYTLSLTEMLDVLLPTVKRTGTVYICGDWLTSASIYPAAADRLQVRNRITWEREKGRGAKTNWKNSSEDIWFCTKSHQYIFNVEAVKVRRRVIAPYRDTGGAPRDWEETADGNFRDTHPSNLWTDITVPFWSMPECTEHPAQKSEKLLAKLVLASTNPGSVLFDPFLGSGTSSVVARKLDRRFVGIELVEEFALLAQKRIELASQDRRIQGYTDQVFWERNTNGAARRSMSNSAVAKQSASNATQASLPY